MSIVASNKPLIFSTFAVLNLDVSIEVNDTHPENISDISFVLVVFILLRSIEVKDEHPLKRPDMLSAFDVSILPKFTDTNDLHPEKVLAIELGFKPSNDVKLTSNKFVQSANISSRVFKVLITWNSTSYFPLFSK